MDSRETIKAWIDGIPDTQLLTLRFGNGRGWCTQMRAELHRLVDESTVLPAPADPTQTELEVEKPGGVW